MAQKRQAKRTSSRIPVGGNTQKLYIPEELKDKNYHYVWVNDTPGNIKRYQDGGYEIVEDREGLIEVGAGSMDNSRFEGSAVVTHVGRTRDEANTPAVLMRIHKKYYEEDKQAKREEIQEIESSMYQRNKGQEGFYEEEHDRKRSSKM